MPMRITMTQTRMGEAGSLLVSGSTYTVSDKFGQEMVGYRYATDTDGVLSFPKATGRLNLLYDPLSQFAVSGDGTVIEIGGGGGSSTFAGLSDKTSADIPATNTPTANALALKAPLASPTFTGTPAAPTAAKGTNTTQVATTAFVIERTGGASAVVDAIDLTLTSSHADTNRAPSGALTYTVNASTGWAVGEGMVVWLPTSGVLTFAVSGGPTINGGTSSITRALLDNAGGYVVLSRIQGSSAYAVTGF